MRSLAALFALLLLAATAPAVRPSFSCSGTLTSSEKAICADPELAAWDRAVARVYRVQTRDGGVSLVDQRRWIADRNRCGADRTCLLKVHREWLGWQSQSGGFGTVYQRADSTRNDYADLEVLPIYDGWIYFSISAIHMQGSETLGVHAWESWGLIELKDGKATFDEEPGDNYACRFHIERTRKDHWLIDVFGENTQCGGLNVTMNGEYRQSSHRRH